MNYYLTHMEYEMIHVGIVSNLTQLVQASTPENARIAVEEDAKNEKGDDIMIFSIRVDDALIGK